MISPRLSKPLQRDSIQPPDLFDARNLGVGTWRTGGERVQRDIVFVSFLNIHIFLILDTKDETVKTTQNSKNMTI